MSRLASLLEANSELLLQSWIERLREGVAPEGTTRTELRDHIPLFLRELVGALRSGAAPETSEVAKAHGRQREDLGFDIEALVREYGLLRRAILDIVDAQGMSLSSLEVRVLTDFVSLAIAEGVVAHGAHQKRSTTAREAREVELAREREIHLATTLGSIGDGVISTDTRARITFLNPVAARLTGWTSEEATGHPIADVFHLVNEVTREPVASPVELALTNDRVMSLEAGTLLVRKDGTETPIDDSAGPIHDAQGRVTGAVLVFRDITERKRADLEREQSHAREREARAEAQAERDKLTAVLSQIPVAIAIITGSTHTYSFANAAYRLHVGGKDPTGQRLTDAIPGIRGQGFDVLLDGVMRTGMPYFGKEVPAKLGDGDEESLVDFVFAPLRSASGTVDSVIVSATDVTATVRARNYVEELAEQVRVSESQLRSVTDALPVLVSWIKSDQTYGFVNRAYEEWFGISRDDVLGKTTRDLIGDAAYAQMRPFIERGIAGESVTFELLRVPYRLGGTRDVRASFVPYLATSGMRGGYIALLADITEERRLAAEREALASARTEVLESMGDAFFALDEDWRVTMVNRLYEHVTQKSRAETLGRNFWELFPETADPATEYSKAYHRCMKERVPVSFVAFYAPLDVWTDVRVYPTTDRGIAVFFRDVSIQKRAELALEQQREFEQQLIGIVSHDLRNPLNVVVMGANVLSDRDDLDASAKKVVARMLSSADRATRLVRDLLDFTKARLGGGLPVYPQNLDLVLLVSTLLDEIRVAHPGRDIELSGEAEIIVTWDADRIGQMMLNLVTNALKYSAAKTVVRVRLVSDPDAVTLAVHNEGVAIPADKLPTLFQPFQRAVTETDNVSRSVGLGLYIVTEVVSAHGGTVSVESTDAAGTTFRARIPRTVVREGEP